MMCSRFLAVLVLCCSISAATLAQIGPASHTLQVHVVLSTTGEPVSGSVRVQVSDLSGTPMAEAFTNHAGGVAEFSQAFFDGTYRLVISGPNIETTSREFTINPIESEHREYVHVKPTPIGKSEIIPAPDNQDVSVASMEVPDKARNEFEKAMQAYAKGDLVTTESLLKAALATYPKYARAHNNLGVLYLRQNDKVKARQEFLAAIKYDSGLSSAYVNLGKIDISENHLPEAERELQKAVAVNPSALSALVLLSSTQYANGDYDEALATIKRIHSLPHHNVYGDVHLVAAEIYLKRKEPAKAIGEYKLFLEERPSDARVAKVKRLIATLESGSK